MNEERLILNKLLDKYEQSIHFSQPGQSTRRVMLKPERNDIPEYEFQNAGIRDQFNNALNELKESHLIQITWLKGRGNMVAKEIWLNLDMIDAAYTRAYRQPLRIRLSALCALLESAAGRVSTNWLKTHLTHRAEQLQETGKISGMYKKGEHFLKELLSAMEHYDRLSGADITMRAFSIACYSDSKRFERIYRDAFLAEMRLAHPGLRDLLTYQELSLREQLDYLGIHARPEIFEFSGPLVIETALGQCDLSVISGSALTSYAARSILRIHGNHIAHIIFIENKTNYDEYIEKSRRKDELVVYHGGFMSHQKKAFFRQIALSVAEDIQIHFWADIDLGGFKMYQQLRSVIPQLEPWRMSASDVERYAVQGLERSPLYLLELKKYQRLPDAAMFCDSIDAILSCGRTIEQESMLNELP